MDKGDWEVLGYALFLLCFGIGCVVFAALLWEV